MNNIAAIQDDRIMADGRPAFAWWNEIQMLRQREPAIQKREMALAEKFTVLRIAEWAIMPLMTIDGNDDLIIRVRRSPLILSKIGASDLAEHPEKYCEVMSAEPLPREEPRK